MIPAIPILRPGSVWCFVHPKDVDPWPIKETHYLTSALKFGEKFDLLGLSQIDQLIDNGIMDVTDCLDSDISVAQIYYRTKRGKVSFMDLANIATNQFVAPVNGDYRNRNIDLSVAVNKFGSPKNLLDKQFEKLYRQFIAEPNVSVRLMGTVNLQFGTVIINGCSDPDIELIGYTLRAYRENLNRSPVQEPAKCPFVGFDTMGIYG